MFFLQNRRILNLLSLAVLSLVIAYVFWGHPLMGISAVVIAVFLIVATVSVFIASRDKVTTMSLLPVWTGNQTDAGKP